MSLYNKLNILSDKLDHYSLLLKEKTEEINDLTMVNQDETIKNWNKCKSKLSRELKQIDNNINKFIKDSNNCINNFKKNDETHFGNDEDEVYSVEEHMRSVEERVYLSEKYKTMVLDEPDINKKVYNSLLYGNFSRYFNNDRLGSMMNSDYTIHINNAEERLKKFVYLLKDNNALLAGGYINMAVNFNDYPYYPMHSDLDIYINKKNIEKFIDDIMKTITILTFKFDISSPYLESFFRKNGLLSRLVLMAPGIRLDILIIRDDYNLLDVIKNFDLSYCSVYLDPSDLKIKGNINDMITKSSNHIKISIFLNYLLVLLIWLQAKYQNQEGILEVIKSQ